MKGIQVRKGAILLWRLGPLQHGEQDVWDRAPLKRGMWAFPWPYFDMGFAYHQYGYAAPKRLQVAYHGDTDIPSGWPLDRSWYRLGGAAIPENAPIDFTSPTLGVAEEFWRAREAWHEEVGKRILPIKKFWYSGDLYSHIDRRGQVGDTGTFEPENTDWYRLDAADYGRSLVKSGGDRFVEYRDRGDGKMERSVWRSSVAHMEVFLAPGQGKIMGKP